MISQAAVRLWILVFALLLMSSDTVHGQHISKLLPTEAKRILSDLGVPFSQEAFFKAIEQDDVRIVRLFHFAGLDLDMKHPPFTEYHHCGSPWMSEATKYLDTALKTESM